MTQKAPEKSHMDSNVTIQINLWKHFFLNHVCIYEKYALSSI